jgi:hypothetical protein
MSTPSISTKDMESWQLRLDTRFPRVPMLRPDQVAAGLGCTSQSVANLFAPDGRGGKPWIMGIEFNARGSGINMARRIPRENAILFWAASANYRPDDFMALLLDVVDGLHVKERLLVQQRIQELNRRQS